jgi:hypothetical protein
LRSQIRALAVARRLLNERCAMQQPTPENPYGLQRPPFPPTSWAPPPYPVPAMAPTQPAPAVDPAARPAAITLFASAVAMLVGVASFSWFSRGGSGVGLYGVQECMRYGCNSMMWSDLPRAPAEYALFGYVGLLALVTAISLSIHAGVVLLKNTASRAKVRALNGALGVAAFCTVSFWMRLQFGELGHRLTVGYAGIVCIAGVIAAGTVAHRTVRRLARS